MPLRHFAALLFAIIIVLISEISWYAVGLTFQTESPSGTTPIAVLWGLSVVVVIVTGIVFDRTIFRPLLRFKQATMNIGTESPNVDKDASHEQNISDVQSALEQITLTLSERDKFLEEREERFATLFQRIPDAVFVFDMETLEFEEANQAALALFGYTHKEFVTHRLLDLSAEPEGTREALDRLAQGKLKIPVSRTFRRKDGNTFSSEIYPSLFIQDERRKCVAVVRDVTDRDRMQHDLLQSVDQLKELDFIVGQSPMVVFLWRAEEDWPVEYVSENIRHFGYAPDDFYSGRVPYASIIHAEDLDRVGKEVSAFGQDPACDSFAQEYRILAPDGQVFTIDDRTWIRRNDKGEITHYQGVILDITDRKQIEDYLRASRDVLRSIVENIPLRVFWKDDALRFLGCNTLFAHDAGMQRPEDLLGKDDTQMVWRDHAELYRADDQKVIDTDTPILSYEEPQTTPDGATIWLRTSKVPLHDTDGTVNGILGIYEDITARKAAEIELQETLQKLELFRRTVDQSSDMLFVIDAEAGRFIDVNETACARLGYSREELLSLGPKDIEADLPKNFSWSRTVNRLRKSDGDTIQGRTICKDGTTFPVEVSVKYVAHHNRDVVIAVTRDITERIETERALRYAQKIDALGNLAGGIAHNMNNLLLPIMSLTSMTLRDLPEDSRARRRLEKVAQAASEGKALVQQIIDFSRRNTEEGRKTARNLRDAVKESLDLVMVSVPSSIDVTEDLGEAELRAEIDQNQITTMVMNVVSNAVDAFEGKVGKMTISLTGENVTASMTKRVQNLQPGNYAKLTISDSGRGMDEQTLERVFDPFFTTKSVDEGNGLGLSTVLGIVEKHNGAIGISSAPGKGTTVTIYLPISASVAATS